MPKDFKYSPRRRGKPKKIDPVTGKPFTAGSGSLAHLKPQRKRRQWDLSPDHRPMILDDTYDRPTAAPPEPGRDDGQL